MKIIDTHTHFPGTSFGGRPRSGVELREEFESEGLTGAWIMTTDGLLKDCARHNDLLAEGVRDHLDFFVPFCTVSPHDGAEVAIRELERSVGQLNMKGLKFHPWLQVFSMTHPAVISILKRAGELKIPVIFHDGTPPHATPLQIAYAAEKAPRATIILGHTGLDDLYEDAIRACLRQSNIYLCLCGLSAGFLAEIVRRCPVERLLFGSDAGFVSHLITAAYAKLQTAGLPDHLINRIVSENPQRLVPQLSS